MTSGVKKTPPTSLAALLRDIREHSGLTQAELGTVFGTGGGRVCGWEIGSHEPTLATLTRYAEFAGIDVADLFALRNPRPYAAAARALCPESDPHHDRVWFCTTCRMIEQRLTPVSDLLRKVLDDADLTVTYDRESLFPAEPSVAAVVGAERPEEVRARTSDAAPSSGHPGVGFASDLFPQHQKRPK